MGRRLPVLLLLALSGPALAGKANKVRKQIDAGDYAAAQETALASLEKHPDDMEVLLLLAQADYLAATEQNTLEAYETYLRAWQESPYTDRVREQMAHLAFEQIAQTPTVEGYQAFRRAYPHSALVAESMAREENLAWDTARASDTQEAYAGFAGRYPSSRFAPAALAREAELVWAEVARQDGLDGYLAFLRDYPDSPRVAEATERSQDLAWDRAREQDDIPTWREYREAFDGTRRAEQAYERELELAWTGALDRHEIPAYRLFEMGYPDTDEALQAEDREWDLYHYQRELYPGELRPSITRARRQPDGFYELWFDVIDDRGNLVGGLQQEHFTVYDAGYEGEVIEVLGMEHNRPVDVVFVVDVSGSMSDEIDGVKEGIQRFANIMQLRSRDMRLGLVTFIEEVFAVNGSAAGGPLTANVPGFGRWVDRIDTGAPGSREDHLMALDRVAGLNFREDAQKVLVLLSDEDATLRNFRDPVSFGDRLSREDFTVYSVTPRTRTFEALVDRTSGALFELPDYHTDFAPIMDALAQKISKQYRLRYRRPAEAPPVIGDLEVVLRIRTEHAWLANRGNSGGAGYALVRWHPAQREAVFFAGVSGGLLCSGDGARSLVPCGTGLPLTSAVQDLVFSGDEIYARTADGGVHRSSDGGLHFSPATLDSGIAIAIAPDPSEQGRLIASDGSLLWRWDGSTWTPTSVWEPPSGVARISTHPSAPIVLLTDGDGGVWRSTDAGGYFEPVHFPGQAPSGFAFHPTRQGLAFAWGDDGLWRSLDDGLSWRSLTLPAQGAQVNAVLFDPSMRRLTLALTDQGVFASNDLGRSWYDQSTGLDDPVSSGAVSPGGQVVLTSPTSGSVYGMQRVANREFVFSSLFFGSGAVRPNAALLPHLDELAHHLQSDPTLVLRVEGHTDSDGSEPSNQKLSEDRALWVGDYLEKKGVSPHQLQTSGYGETRPLFPNDTVKNKARNRRVELVLVTPERDLPTGGGMR